LNYQPVDRLPVYFFGTWRKTGERWRPKGLPPDGFADHGPQWPEMDPLWEWRMRASPAEFRRRHGKRLRIFGGVDRLVIPQGAAHSGPMISTPASSVRYTSCRASALVPLRRVRVLLMIPRSARAALRASQRRPWPTRS
jgi:hypothetical protein